VYLDLCIEMLIKMYLLNITRRRYFSCSEPETPNLIIQILLHIAAAKDHVILVFKCFTSTINKAA
jgi:hypothetical protein